MKKIIVKIIKTFNIFTKGKNVNEIINKLNKSCLFIKAKNKNNQYEL